MHGAAEASDQLGDRQRGEGYRRIAAALGGTVGAAGAGVGAGEESKPQELKSLAEGLEEVFGPDRGRRDEEGEGLAAPRRVADGETSEGVWEAESSEVKLSDVGGDGRGQAAS